MITVLPTQHRHHLQLLWVIQAVQFFIAAIPGNTQHDKDAGISQAAQFFAVGASAANSIYQGYDHARQSIKQRNQNLTYPQRSNRTH